MSPWYWSAATLIWQVSIDYNMDVKYHEDVRCKPGIGISWSMAAMLCDVVVVVGRTRPRSVPLAMSTMKKSCMGSFSMHARGSFSIVMVLRLAALPAARSPRYKPTYTSSSKRWPSMSYKLEPAIWSSNTGQWLPCFDRMWKGHHQ